MPRALLLGCALGLACLSARAETIADLPTQDPEAPWPTDVWAEAAPRVPDAAALERAVDALMDFEPGPVPQTRAVLIVQGGRLVLERYADGFERRTRFVSWSMAKTVTQAMVGILVREGRLDLDAPPGIELWQGPGDPRGAVTLRQLLQMTSGLANADRLPGPRGSQGFVSHMLFGAGSQDAARFAADVPLLHEPGSHWAYSTGTSVILGALVGDRARAAGEDIRAFAQRELFGPIGMRSAIPELDAAGSFLGGAFVWATARDWARFGLLYLRDGVWEQRRILPEGWVAFSRTPSSAEGNRRHGAHLWINRGFETEEVQRAMPQLPETTFSAQGRGGQYVVMVPSKDLVVVRLGENGTGERRELSRRVGAVAAAFPEVSAPEVSAPVAGGPVE